MFIHLQIKHIEVFKSVTMERLEHCLEVCKYVFNT